LPKLVYLAMHNVQGHSSGLAPGSPAWLLGTYYGVLDQDQDSARLTPEVKKLAKCCCLGKGLVKDWAQVVVAW
jgi:hypothetical protein